MTVNPLNISYQTFGAGYTHSFFLTPWLRLCFFLSLRPPSSSPPPRAPPGPGLGYLAQILSSMGPGLGYLARILGSMGPGLGYLARILGSMGPGMVYLARILGSMGPGLAYLARSLDSIGPGPLQTILLLFVGRASGGAILDTQRYFSYSFL